MRYVYSAAAIAIALSVLVPPTAFGQGGTSNFSITNYQLQGEQRYDRTSWYVTYTADLVNVGPALASATATVTSLAPNVHVVAGQGTLHFSPVPANSQVHSTDSFTILVDRSVAFDWSQVQWSFQAPRANPGSSQTVPLGSTVTLNGCDSTNASGIGGLTYSWTFVQLPVGSSAVLSNANTMIATFVADVPGTYTIRLAVSAGSASDSATVTASTLYSPPVANAGPDQTVSAGATVHLDGTKSSDVDGLPLTYSWSFISRPSSSLAALNNPQSATPSFVVDVAGTYKVQLIVNDGQTNSQPATVIVTTGNVPPVAVAACNNCTNLKVNGLVQLDGSKSTDVNGKALTYSWSLNASGVPGSKAALGSANIVNPTFTADLPGTYVAQLIVSNGTMQSQPATVTITTDDIMPPTATAGPDQTVHIGSVVQLSGSGSDPQSLTLTYGWSLITRPTGSTAALSATNIQNPTFTADLPGIYVVQLIVNDGYLSSSPSTAKITTTNTPPVAVPTLTNQGGVYVGNTVYLSGATSYDPDNDKIVSYSWSLSIPPGSHAALLNPTTVSPNFVADIAGTYVAQLIVKDAYSSSAPATLSITAGTAQIGLSLVNNPSGILYCNSSGTLTVTLSPPAGSSPVIVTLSGIDNNYDNGLAVDLPNSVTVPAYAGGANVTIGALALTDRMSVTETIHADAPGYYQGSLTVTVQTPIISVALNNNATTVGLNQSAGGKITLNSPAPQGGTTVSLSYVASPNGAVSFTPGTVTIPAGSTTGTFNVTGTTAGQVTIMAGAPGYSRGTLDVNVTTLGIISFSPQAVPMGAGGVQNFTILLSATAPTGGLSITLASDNTSAATVTPSVSINAGGTSATAQVTGVAPGVAHITGTTTNQFFSAANASVTVSVTSLSMTPSSLPAGTAGAQYTSTTLTASGGTGQGYTWSITGGQLPSGLTLSAAGVLSGTLSSSASTSTFTIQVQDGGGSKATQQFTITVSPALSITTTSLPNGTPGAAYTSTTLAATGGTGQGYTWSVTNGQPPSGLTLSSAGVLSGTLSSSATTSTFTVQVQDSGANKATQQFTITVYSQLTITTSSLPSGTPGAQYTSTTLTASGGTGQGYAWSVTVGQLPSGLTLSAAGVLSGTLSSSATASTFTVQVQDNGSNKATQQFTISVYAQLAITAASLPNGTAGAQYTSTTLAATGGTGQGYAWSVTVGQLPSGLTLSSAGVLSGTLSSSGATSTFTVQVQDSASNKATQQFTITVALTVTTSALPGGTAGTQYTSTTLAASGGTGQGYTWSVTVGQLPSGLTLSPAGVLSGTLSSSATTSTFTVQVQDGGGTKATQQFTITLSSQLAITTASLPTGTAGSQYPSTTLAATGGTGQGYTWSVTVGQLPSGLTLSSAGVLSGTLSSSATNSTFTVQVQDGGGNKATQQFTITVTLTITTASLPNGAPGALYTSTTLAATGGTGQGYTWSVTVGQLPSGLALSSAGVLSGTLSSSATNSTFTIQVQDGGGNKATQQFTIAVTLSITTASLPSGTPGAAYTSTTLAASGGTGQGYTWSVTVGQLPSGLTLSSAGVLSGTLSNSAVGTTFTIQVQDGGGNKATQQFSIAFPLTINTSTLPNGTPGGTYSTTLNASGGTGQGYTWSVTGGRLPAGVTLSAAGVLSGSLSSWTGDAVFTVQVLDGGGNTATKQLTLTVTTDLTITTQSLPAGTPGAAYPSTTLAAGGGTGQGYTWSLTLTGQLPVGLTLSAAGVLSGTLSSSATSSTFVIQVQDSGGNRATQQFTITIAQGLSITTTALPSGKAGDPYTSTTLAATGGTGQGYTWSVTAGQLPSGLALSSAGVISGTLSSSANTSTFTAQVQDSGGNKATQQFTIAISGPLAIITASVPSGTPGLQYASTTLAAAGGTGQGYTWSVTGGQLPSGLTLSSAGVLSGTLSSSATTWTCTMQVQDSGGNKATKQFTIAVNVIITTASLPSGMPGSQYGPATLAASGGTGQGYTWSVTVGQLPAGLTLSPAGVLSGTLSTSATSATFTIQVQDGGGATGTQQYTIVLPLTVITSVLPSGVPNGTYPSTSLVASGGTGQGYTWSLTGGRLPPGLSLSSGGVLSGSVTNWSGSATFTAQVQDSGGNTASKQLTVNISSDLTINTVSLPAGTAGAAYTSTTLAAVGGTGQGYTWSVSVGQLPSGLSLSSGGVLSGTLSVSAVTSTFTVQVQDSGGAKTTQQFSITVNPALSITTSSLPSGMAGALYTCTPLAATGGTGQGYTWSITVGQLPSALTLSPGGLICGTLSTSATTSTFTVQVQDSGGNKATQQFTLTVTPVLSVTTTSLPSGTAGALYTSTTLAATGGTGQGYAWSVTVGQLPSGLALSSGGVISGTLSSSATTSTFTVQVQDSGSGKATQQFTITVNQPPTITAGSLPSGTAGALYTTTTLVATGGTGQGYTWSVTIGQLPAGLNLSTAGVISGTLSSSATTSTFTVQVQDSGGSKATQQFTITVYPPVSITTTSLPNGVAGMLYTSTTLAATGGTGQGYTWSVTVGQPPTGLTLSTGGVISGTLSSSATTSTFTVQVQDGGGNKATQQFTLTVTPPLSITSTTLPTGTPGALYPTTTLAATGGTGQGYTWSVTVGQLPSGLSLSAAGVISGTLSSSATNSTFTIQVQDSGGIKATQQFTLPVNVIITTASLPSGTPGALYTSTTLAAAGGTGQGYTWSVTAGQLPAGLALSSGGVLSGTLSGSATNSIFTVQAQDSGNAKGTQQFTIAVAVSITAASLPNGTPGALYTSTTLAATGGTGQGYTWSVTVGQLPSGLTLSSGGVISGTLSTSATSATFTVQAQDSGGNKGTQQFTLTVNPALTITTVSLPGGTPGALYTSTTLAATGGSGQGYTWSVTVGQLPAGLSLSSGGVISGTLSSSATNSTFTVQVQDSGNAKATQQFTIAVAVAVTTASLPDGTAGALYTSTTLAATGGTGQSFTWSVTVGQLPTGLTLSSAGVISGTLSSSATTSTFTVQAQDGGGNKGTRQFTITVYQVLTITTASLPNGTAGALYTSTTLAASGGTGQGYTWSVTVGQLPSGLALSSAGVISGTLSSSATTSTFTVQVQDGGGNKATKQFTLTVNPVLAITTPSLPSGVAGALYTSTTLAATGGTGGYTWSVTVGQLPSGLTLSGAGVISGTLSSSATTSTFTVQVQDSSSNKATQQFTITVIPPLAITTASLPSGTAGALYTSTTLAATGGTGGYTWSVTVGQLPTGLTLSAAGVLSGTLSSSAATSTFTIQAQDSGGNKATQQFTITVVLTVTTSALPSGTPGALYTSTTLAATGGTGQGYTWSVTVGQLPSGLSLSAAGVISGTLSTSATSATFTVQVQDGGGTKATQQFTIAVTLSITTASLPSGTPGAQYTSTTLAATGGTGQGYTWSVTVGQLPSGLTLSSAGVLSGALSISATTSTFTVQVQDGGGNKATQQFTITATLTVTTSSLPNGTPGAQYTSTTLAASGGTGLGYTWSVTVGQLPSGLSLSSGGVISGTLSSSATTSTFTVQVQDGGGTKATQQFTLTINLSVTASALPAGTLGAQYSATLAASGGTGQSYTWSLTVGQLPSGLSLSSGGVISGTLSSSATSSTFTVQVQDSAGTKATRQFNITVTLTITTTSLPNGTTGSQYSTTLAASGGTGQGYIWSIADGQPPSGVNLSSAGVISGTLPGSPTVSTFTVQVQDSGGTQAIRQFTITVTNSTGGPGTITVTQGGGTSSSFAVGVGLQVPVTITFSPLPTADVSLTISSSNPASVLLGNSGTTGKSSISVTVAAGTTSVQTYVQAVAASASSITVTAAASGYGAGTATVTIANSAFVISGPNGTGGAFTAYQGTTTPLTVYAGRLDSSGLFAESQQVAGGLSFTVPLAVMDSRCLSQSSTLGSLSPSSITFTGGTSSTGVNYTAPQPPTVGTACLVVTQPPGFTDPTTGELMSVTIQQVGVIAPSGITIGQNLQATAKVSLQGNAPTAVPVTLTSSDPTKLKFASGTTCATTPGSGSITVTIPQNHSSSPDFCIFGYANSGSIGYTISTSDYGTVTSSMPMGPSGLVVQTSLAGGVVTSVTVPLGSGLDENLYVFTALLNGSGGVVAEQAPASDVNVSATVTSSNTATGTILNSPIQISGGSNYATTAFHPLAAGTSTITASATGFAQTTVAATVTSAHLVAQNFLTVGQYLEQQAQVILSTPAPAGGAQVTLTSNSSQLKLAANANDAGSSSITVTVAQGGNTASYWVYALGSSGTATYTATATGYGSATDTVTLAKSGVVILGPNACISCTVSLAAGAATFTVQTIQLNSDGSVPIPAPYQPLAGNVSLIVTLGDTNRGAGNVAATTQIDGGNSVASVTFTPVGVGSTVVSITEPGVSVNWPNGWTTPIYGSYALVQVMVGVVQ